MGTILWCTYSRWLCLCIHPIEWKQWSDVLKIMTRTSCLGTVKCSMCYIYLRRKENILIFSVILLNTLSKSLHDQHLLDYFWDIGRDWERLQGTTTLHERLITHMKYKIWNIPIELYFASNYNFDQSSDISLTSPYMYISRSNIVDFISLILDKHVKYDLTYLHFPCRISLYFLSYCGTIYGRLSIVEVPNLEQKTKLTLISINIRGTFRNTVFAWRDQPHCIRVC